MRDRTGPLSWLLSLFSCQRAEEEEEARLPERHRQLVPLIPSIGTASSPCPLNYMRGGAQADVGISTK